MSPRILFLHGLEGSPSGNKPTWLRAAGYDVRAPQLPTDAVARWLERASETLDRALLEPAVTVASDALREEPPDLLVGSSFGGGLAVELAHRGLFRGPMVLLAPAARKLYARDALPSGQGRVLVLHGRRDDVVPCEDSLALAARSSGEVQLWLVEDDHRLSASVAAGLLGRMIDAALDRRPSR
jgi:pimeloyl-ACP methyl ester carboxylesterase